MLLKAHCILHKLNFTSYQHYVPFALPDHGKELNNAWGLTSLLEEQEMSLKSGQTQKKKSAQPAQPQHCGSASGPS